MGRHKMPQRTKRRLIAAGVAAAAVIGSGVVIGVSGFASARSSNPFTNTSKECLPEATPPSTTAAPPPAQTSTSAAATSTSTSAADSSTAAPPASSSSSGAANQQSGRRHRLAGDPVLDLAPTGSAQPNDAPKPDDTVPTQDQAPAATDPAPPAAPKADNGSGAAEAGAPPPAQPAQVAPSDAVQSFAQPSCNLDIGPFANDFVSINKVPTKNLDARPGRNASRGTFTERCGTNENHHNNPANFIVAPGNANGAHHDHDYVGNTSTDGNSTNESLAAAGTTCRNGDKSTFYWPVLRVRDNNNSGNFTEAENPHNVGTILQPDSAVLQWRGNAASKVVAMPEFIRIITGDAKANVNGGANGNAKWTCTGFVNRFTTKYPICPSGSRIVRVLDFPSCWDGVNTDSANHRTHVVFPAANGACAQGFKAIPQLRMTLTYTLPRGLVFAVDSFPEALHNPITDHGDFTNVMPKNVSDAMVAAINSGRKS
jgi:hypothetical protein